MKSTISLPASVPVRARGVQVQNAARVFTAEELVRAAQLADEQKRALQTTIKNSTLPPKAIAMDVGLRHDHLLNCGNPLAPHHLPFARLPLVLHACDDLTLLRFLAGLQGCEVVRLPRAGATGDARRAAATMREVAEFLEAGAGATEDDVVSPDEFARVEREGAEAVRAILEHVAHYRARVRRPLLEGV